MEYFIGLVVLVVIFGMGYCVGHQNAWLKWETWTKDERLSQKTRNRIAGIEK